MTRQADNRAAGKWGRAVVAEAKRRDREELAARASLFEMPPVPGVPKNVAGRPDWKGVSRSPTRAFRLAKRICNLLGEATGFKLLREWAGCSCGVPGVAHLPFVEPIHFPGEKVVERIALASRFARDLAKRPTVAEAEVIARRHDLKVKDVVADAELWSGEPFTALVRADREAIRAARREKEAQRKAAAADRARRARAAGCRAAAATQEPHKGTQCPTPKT